MLTEIIRRIREAGTPFEQRVMGTASLDAAYDKASALAMPWASVLALPHPHAIINARAALWYALLAWAPTECDGALTYAGSRHLRMDRGRLWHLFLFESDRALDATSAQQDPTNGDGSLVPFLRFAPEYAIPRTEPLKDTILSTDMIAVPGAQA
jgi:hypothetical protein